MIGKTIWLVLLLLVLTIVLVLMGKTMGDTIGVLVALLLVLSLTIGFYAYADQMLIKIARARPMPTDKAPWFADMVGHLAQQANVAPPHLYIIGCGTPNAFVIGRNTQNSMFVVTTGILHLLTRDELRAVSAQAIAHIRQPQLPIVTIASALAGSVLCIVPPTCRHWFSRVALLMLSPLALALIHAGISRTRELVADAEAAHMLGDPLSLASALEKLEWAAQQVPMAVNPGTAPVYMVSPLQEDQLLGRLFSPQPATTRRVARLRAMVHQSHLVIAL
ncbi:MAG: M48 family metalloprotease [Chloroflexaceae bacterium]|nr:M48 family metalloprotease [Chloroflexaceae bacterium]